jgi:hypothetical protein
MPSWVMGLRAVDAIADNRMGTLMMKRAMKLTAVALGAYASVLGMVHGAFAMQQRTAVSGLLFFAIALL